ncbi:MAG: aminotransferase [Rhizobiales bacterium]|nr:aminotransferase [Hyphomicrobiales bacterium]
MSSLPPPFALNSRVLAVDAPPIPEAQAWKTLYSGDAGPMIDLSQAVPSTPPPASVLKALGEAAASSEASRYGPILGDARLRAAHAAETGRIYRAELLESQVAITAGCNQAFVSVMMALAGAGDSVILPAPWYFNHRMTLDMLGIDVDILPARPEAGFVPDVEEAAYLIRPSTRAIILVSPNNPTGAVYPPNVIAAFAALCRARSIALVLDETYRDFLAPGAPPHRLFQAVDWGDTLISLYSFSKAHAIPGHRLGAVMASSAVITELAKWLDCIQICPARAAQGVIARAITEERDWRLAQADDLAQRAEATRQAFARLNGWSLVTAGAYFAFVRHPYEDARAVDVARRLALEAGVLALPGSYFGPGQEQHLRFAFANVDSKTIAEIPHRIAMLT